MNYTLGAGLFVLSQGSVRISNATASNNVNGAGVFVDNGEWTNTVTVTLAGFVTAVNNGGDGVYVVSTGTVSMSKVNASGNLGTAQSLMLGNGVAVMTNGTVTLTCGNVSNNHGYGVEARDNFLISGSSPLVLNGVVLLNNGAGNIFRDPGIGLTQSRICALP